MNEEVANSGRFKFNMSFYYQSTIVYFVFFLLYMVIRGEFVEDSFKLITKDPIIYFFGIVVITAVISLLYNLYLNKYLIINGSGIEFRNRHKAKRIDFDEIESIRVKKRDKKSSGRAFQLIRVKLKNKRRVLLIRPHDYENEEILINRFIGIKENLGK